MVCLYLNLLRWNSPLISAHNYISQSVVGNQSFYAQIIKNQKALFFINNINFCFLKPSSTYFQIWTKMNFKYARRLIIFQNNNCRQRFKNRSRLRVCWFLVIISNEFCISSLFFGAWWKIFLGKYLKQCLIVFEC